MSEEKKNRYQDLNLDGPSELEFTKALEKLKSEDRDIFENTGLIHIDRDMPAQTQAMHVVNLTKKHEKKRNHIYHSILLLLMAGVLISIAGLSLNRMMRNAKKARVVEEVQEGIHQNEDWISIGETEFPDALFRSYVLDHCDTNQDGMLSPDERNAVLVLMVPADSSLTSLQGIEYFPLLKSLTFQSTGVVSVNLTVNEKLEYINCNGSAVESLDLTNNPELTAIHAEGTNLMSLLLPQESKIRDLSVSNLGCKRNEEGIYTSCE